MSNTPKVSVVLPNYNHSLYLRERIDSILNQTYQDFELIILDDKSPDNSVEIIESYRNHEKVSHIVINTENSGSTFRQWDKGFSLASGEYIWIAESDDYAEPTFLERCVAALVSNDKAALAFADSNFVNENGKKCKCWIEQLEIPESEDHIKDGAVRYLGVDFVRDYLLYNNNLYNASMILFRKSALNGVSNYYRTFRGSGDWVFWAEMVIERELMHIPERLSSFRQHTNKVSSKMLDDGNRYFEAASIFIYITNLFAYFSKLSNCNSQEIIESIKIERANYAKSLLDKYNYLQNPNNKDKKFLGGLIKITNVSKSKRCNLSLALPLYKIKYKPNKENHYLLGFIPFIKIK
ncbi:MAG: glycosyltransferase [Rikenellaceae bacterium]